MNTEHVQRQPQWVLIIHSQEPLVEFLKLGLSYEGFHVEATDHPYGRVTHISQFHYPSEEQLNGPGCLRLRLTLHTSGVVAKSDTKS